MIPELYRFVVHRSYAKAVLREESKIGPVIPLVERMVVSKYPLLENPLKVRYEIGK